MTAPADLPAKVDAVVIGSGALGAATAWHLLKAGLSVALVDKAELASQTSARAAGLSGQLRSNPVMTRIAAMSVGTRFSREASSLAKASVSAIIASIWSMSPSSLRRCSSSATYSARSLRRVSGVRRSCEIAAIICVRSSTKRFRRPRISLKARAMARSSAGPLSRISGASRSMPRRTVAAAS